MGMLSLGQARNLGTRYEDTTTWRMLRGRIVFEQGVESLAFDQIRRLYILDKHRDRDQGSSHWSSAPLMFRHRASIC